MTKLTLINHSSLLIKEKGYYIFTDPWHTQPAFGSWLPTFAQYFHPSYIASLRKKLCILISHGHDDHCDDSLLEVFPKESTILIADYAAPSVFNRIKRNGFENIIKVPINSESEILYKNIFAIKCFVNSEFSNDDAIFTIKTNNGLVIHANDNWFPLSEETALSIKADIAKTKSQKGYLFTQTNSASGYPLNYSQYSKSTKIKLLNSKVKKMILGGFQNAKKLGLEQIYSYAGYATPFVKGKDYHLDSLFPTSKLINNQLFKNDKTKPNVAEFYPGDILDLSSGNIEKAFISSDDYEDEDIKDYTYKYYKNFNILPTEKLNFKKYKPVTKEELKWFLSKMKEFIMNKLTTQQGKIIFKEIEGKSLEFKIEDQDISEAIVFSAKDEALQGISTKICTVNSRIMQSILCGDTLLESLYTGYLGEWERNPIDIYNRDIVLGLVMFSYVWKNRFSSEYKSIFR